MDLIPIIIESLITKVFGLLDETLTTDGFDFGFVFCGPCAVCGLFGFFWFCLSANFLCLDLDLGSMGSLVMAIFYQPASVL